MDVQLEFSFLDIEWLIKESLDVPFVCTLHSLSNFVVHINEPHEYKHL